MSHTPSPLFRPSFLVGDKVVRIENNRIIAFGEVHSIPYDESHHVVHWQDETFPSQEIPTKWTPENSQLNIAVYERHLQTGAIVTLGSSDIKGVVVGSQKRMSVVVAEQNIEKLKQNKVLEIDKDRRDYKRPETVEIPDPISDTETFILHNMNAGDLRPIWKFRVGDSVLYKGWVGTVTKGVAAITYQFETEESPRLKAFMDLKEIVTGRNTNNRQMFVGTQLDEVPKEHLKIGRWSKGSAFMNRRYYKTKSALVEDLCVVSIDVLWVQNVHDPHDIMEPPGTLTEEEGLNFVSCFMDPTKDYPTGSLFMTRWAAKRCHAYHDWAQTFIDELLTHQNDGETKTTPKDVSNMLLPFSIRDFVAVYVLLSQTFLDVISDDGRLHEKIPSWKLNVVESKTELHLPLVGIRLGLFDVVKDMTDFVNTHKTKYGFVLGFNEKSGGVVVHWCTVIAETNLHWEVKEMSQYDILPWEEYICLKGEESQIVLGQGSVAGVVLGVSVPDYKIIIQCPEGPVKTFYPHELDFVRKRVNYDVKDGKFFMGKPTCPKNTCPEYKYCWKNDESANLATQDESLEGFQFFTTDTVAEDHSFYNLIHKPEESSLAFTAVPIEDGTELRKNMFGDLMNLEVEEVMRMREFGSNVFLERIAVSQDKVGLFTTAVLGPSGTIYEDIPFFLDFFLPFRYWEWERRKNYDNLRPKVELRAERISFRHWIHPELSSGTRVVLYPDHCLVTGKDDNIAGSTKSVGFLSKFLAHFLESLTWASGKDSQDPEGNNNNTSQGQDDGGSAAFSNEQLRNYNERALVSLMDYTHAVLCCPPKPWKAFVESHFRDALPRIVRRIQTILKEGLIIGQDQNQNGALYKNESKFLINPVSTSFQIGMETRLPLLKTFLVQ